ncbi:glycine zipper 2TM domain-containing protein [Uliginosibacterium flavum]|uniref:Outer membrane lipoprotein SlyB n=1 Tax=Uliginosibacterium flavum TaxID=1396831 RepID=A0ABV2TJM1_9RHOO
MKHSLLIACLLGSTLVNTGCTRSLAGDSYSREEAQRPISFREGTILEVRKVRLQGTDSKIGMGSGALVGGVAGSGVGSGRGAIVGAVVGAVVGGIAGAAAEEGFTREDAWELTLRMSGGETMIVVQEIGKTDKFAIGDRVRVLQSSGKTRVSPATPAPAPAVSAPAAAPAGLTSAPANNGEVRL